MFELFKQKKTIAGSVIYRGNLSPRAEEYAFLRESGVQLDIHAGDEQTHWSMTMRHPKFGEAKAAAFRNMPPYPQWVISTSQALTAAEKEEFAAAGVGVVVFIEKPTGDVLRDRKKLLHFLRLMMSDDGLFVTDLTSTLIWPRMALDEELSHDADLDVSQIFCTHAVSGENGNSGTWYHTHGLGEIGAYDFDVINPNPDVFGGRTDIDRALAFASIEGMLKPGSDACCFRPGGNVRAVDAAEFDRKASPSDAAIRRMDDDSHQTRRVVLCDPTGGFLSFFRSRPRPSSLLSREIDERIAVQFSSTASQLMSVRAQQTIGLFDKVRREFDRYQFPAIAKIGYRNQSGDLEHLWFSVHGITGDTLDATLDNEPFDVPSLRRGERGRHPIEQLTDWTVLSPAGPISPRGGAAARMLRQNPEKLEEIMTAMRQVDRND